jgi:hypothetical protein
LRGHADHREQSETGGVEHQHQSRQALRRRARVKRDDGRGHRHYEIDGIRERRRRDGSDEKVTQDTAADRRDLRRSGE